jgi:outer membrane receptor protein involved in Fe transport
MQVSARRSRTLQVAIRSAILACCIPALALADNAADAQTTDAAPAAPADTAGLQEIVVTATRREESLSKVPISITALSADDMEQRGIKDISDIVRFTPGVSIDTSGTENISIRGISSSGGAGTTGIYIDDTPIQMRSLAFNPDEEVPKMFDISRVEILRGPQGTLFGAGSEGGTVRYITTQPSLTTDSVYGRSEIDYTQGGAPSYEAGVAAGGPLIDGKFGVRVSLWYRRDGGWIDTTDATTVDPTVTEKNANYSSTYLARVAGVWAVNDAWTVTPSIYFQKRDQHNTDAFWVASSNPSNNQYYNGDPTLRGAPDTFYLPALKIEGVFDAFHVISNTSFYHRQEQTGYEGTEYNLGFYQAFASTDALGNPLTSTGYLPLAPGVGFPLLDATGVHLPADIANYQSPNSVDNDQENIIQEIRLVSSDPNARLVWTTGLFFSENRQFYLEQIHDPMLNAFTESVFGLPYTDVFSYTDPVSGNTLPVPYDPAFPTDSYFLQTHATDKQYAWYGEGTFSFTDTLKATVGLRESHSSFTIDSVTGGPQLFAPTVSDTHSIAENSFTPKVNLTYQYTPTDMVYGTYAKGFRPGGGDNPLPAAACSLGFPQIGITNGQSPTTYNSDTVDSFEVGSKDNFDNRLKIAASAYYIIWHNIQQNVVVPVCQLTFITNLGQAVAKGVDVQLEWAATDALSAEVAAGYTDARYTRDSSLPNGGPTIAYSGEAITGQSGLPNSPFTASVGLEYHATIAQHDSFVRLDWEYEARAKWLSPTQDPGNTAQYDPGSLIMPSNSFVSLRAGMTFGSLSVEPFIDNLTDEHALTNYDLSVQQFDPSGNETTYSRLLRGFSFRPRTFGITFTYKH